MSAIGHALVQLHLISMTIKLNDCFVVAVEAVLDRPREIFAYPQSAAKRGNWLVIADADGQIMPDSSSEGNLLSPSSEGNVLSQELIDHCRIIDISCANVHGRNTPDACLYQAMSSNSIPNPPKYPNPSGFKP